MNSIFGSNKALFSRQLLSGPYHPERLMNTPLFPNFPKVLPVDINENEDNYTIVADLPGFDEDEIEVNIENNVLNIVAEKKIEEKIDSSDEENTSKRIIRERTLHKRTERNIGLGHKKLDTSTTTAELRNGVLTIVVPFAEESLPKKIEVKIKENNGQEKIEELKKEEPVVSNTKDKAGKPVSIRQKTTKNK